MVIILNIHPIHNVIVVPVLEFTVKCEMYGALIIIIDCFPIVFDVHQVERTTTIPTADQSTARYRRVPAEHGGSVVGTTEKRKKRKKKNKKLE